MQDRGRVLVVHLHDNPSLILCKNHPKWYLTSPNDLKNLTLQFYLLTNQYELTSFCTIRYESYDSFRPLNKFPGTCVEKHETTKELRYQNIFEYGRSQFVFEMITLRNDAVGLRSSVSSSFKLDGGSGRLLTIVSVSMGRIYDFCFFFFTFRLDPW